MRGNDWKMEITVKGHTVQERYRTEIEAARAYDRRARKVGRPCNFSDDDAPDGESESESESDDDTKLGALVDTHAVKAASSRPPSPAGSGKGLRELDGIKLGAKVTQNRFVCCAESPGGRHQPSVGTLQGQLTLPPPAPLLGARPLLGTS